MYSISEQESERITLIRGGLAIAVVLVHSYSTGFQFTSGDLEFNSPLWVDIVKHFFSREFGSTGVPSFFLISSILLYRKEFSWSDNIKKKLTSLAVPYLLFNSLWIAGFFLLQLIPVLSDFFPDPDTVVRQWSLRNWVDAYIGLDGYPMLYPLWFLRDLILLNFIAVPFKKCIEKAPKAFLCLFTAIWVFIPESDGAFRESLQSLCFWGFGCCAVCLEIKLSATDIFPAGLCLLIYAFSAVLDETVFRLFPSSELFCIVHRVQILAGILFWFGCFPRLPLSEHLKRLLYTVSAFSFNIYLLHENFLTAAKKLCAFLLPSGPLWLLVEYFALAALITAFCVFFSRLIKKHLPNVYSLLFKGRLLERNGNA